MGSLRVYRILQFLSFLGAAATAYFAWWCVPVPAHAWHSVAWFVLFATLAELLGVMMGPEDSDLEVTPTSPIYWAAAAVLGPFSAIIVCILCGFLSDLVSSTSYHLATSLDSIISSKQTHCTSRIERYVSQFLHKAGSTWEPRAQENWFVMLNRDMMYMSAVVMLVGIGGLTYHWLGGVLLQSSNVVLSLRNFILPFLGLVAAALAVEWCLHLIVMVVIDPIPGANGLYGVLLRMKLILIEEVLPFARAQLFLIVVALQMAYLFSRIGVLGFIVAAMPIVALRDFFHNWVTRRSAYLDTITTLATYMQHYHPYTRGHLKRVAEISTRLARELRLPAESIRHIGHAGLLHDIGKIAVSEEILDKTSKLEPEEWEKIKEHPLKGAEIISHLDFLEGIVDWIKYHHKWHDGRGYPLTNGSDGANIPIEAAIIAVADSFDAMTDDRELSLEWICDSCGHKPENNERPRKCPNCGAEKRRTYREPKTLDGAIDELRRGAGTQFHPRVVKAFLSMIERDGVHLDAR